MKRLHYLILLLSGLLFFNTACDNQNPMVVITNLSDNLRPKSTDKEILKELSFKIIPIYSIEINLVNETGFTQTNGYNIDAKWGYYLGFDLEITALKNELDDITITMTGASTNRIEVINYDELGVVYEVDYPDLKKNDYATGKDRFKLDSDNPIGNFLIQFNKDQNQKTEAVYLRFLVEFEKDDIVNSSIVEIPIVVYE